MVPSYDEILNHKSLDFQDRLKDLKDLRKQLYSAAEHFESSYDETNVDHLAVIESSKDYVVNALVSTVDHLGSVADKLNSFLDEKTDEFSAATIRFSCIKQRLDTFRGLVDLNGISQHSMLLEDPKHNKQYIVTSAETSNIDKPKSNPISSPQYDAHKHTREYNNPFAKSFQQDGANSLGVPLSRKKDPINFPFRRFLSNRERTGKRSVSPLRFSLKRSGSVANRSVSPSPSLYKHRSPSVPRGVISQPEMANSSRETEPYTKRSKQLFKALMDVRKSRK